jgi:hypothetical protein
MANDTINRKEVQISLMDRDTRPQPAPKVETKVEVRYKERIVHKVVEVPVEVLVERPRPPKKKKEPTFEDFMPAPKPKKRKEYIEETYLVMGPCPG